MVEARASVAERFAQVRARTEALAAPLSAEDQQIQVMESASPTKWHRAHTTWFFETFVLAPRAVPPVDPRWGLPVQQLLRGGGPPQPRARRRLRSRSLPARGAVGPRPLAHRDAPGERDRSDRDRPVDLARGERIHTESSVKYDLAMVDDLFAATGFARERTATDGDSLFAVHLGRAA